MSLQKVMEISSVHVSNYSHLHVMITFLCDMKNKTFSFSGSPIQDCRRYKLFITVGLWISLWGIQVEISVTVHKMWLDANSPVLCLAPLSLLHYTVKESFYNVFWVKNDCFVYVRVSILRVGSAKSTTPLVSHVSVLMIVCEKAKKTKKTKTGLLVSSTANSTAQR